jgi:hypothetical protein
MYPLQCFSPSAQDDGYGGSALDRPLRVAAVLQRLLGAKAVHSAVEATTAPWRVRYVSERPRRMPLTAVAGLCLGWALWAGGSGGTQPNLENIENATKSVYRWAGNRHSIRWAIEPDFCEALQPLLWENHAVGTWLFNWRSNYTACDRLHKIVRDAFALWAAANPELHLVEVTQRCTAERLWRPVGKDQCSESTYCIDAENFTDWKTESTQFELQTPPPSSQTCSFRTCFSCDRADVMVGGFTQKNRRLGDAHSYGRVTRTQVTEERPVGTNGLAMPGKSIKRAFLEINMDDVFKVR